MNTPAFSNSSAEHNDSSSEPNNSNTAHSQNDIRLSETVKIAQRLIQFDTTNRGQGNANPERPAAEWVVQYLAELGVAAEIYEAAPGRATVVAQIAGADPQLPGLVLHGHLDVVPADPKNWSVDPFAGVIKNGMLWGRGAVDMKDMDAMMLTAVAEILRAGEKPRRNLTLVFFADEENGGVYGSEWMVRHHPEVFAGAKYAISEVGGYSIYLGDKRAYLLQTGEKTANWMRLTARGVAEHGSRVATDNPLVKLSAALTRLGNHKWPIELGATTTALLQAVSELTGTSGTPEEILAQTGTAAGFLQPSLCATSNPTVIDAGYMQNVIPDTATAIIDVRTLPEKQEETMRQVAEILGPEIEMEPLVQAVGLETEFAGEAVDAMIASLKKFDPEAVVLPYLLSGGTDNKALSALGIIGYGFAPLLLPPELDFPAMFHGVDERVPLQALDFGHQVLTDLLRTF
ncbi:M20/M25/M40 family metallo-hydrolase [Canibacter oris]|uniref:Acetylornithine deacetylase/succinyl-diaminopimelate desuccinylase-like protein n=1 Tax=Canibacter oris TaxID=1365628 RepID=A0A840DGN0_9MICO|nr:acetylornithine deacetylase/succinyl-diaminopimelate desuccinylase-like protein [Canibacter oris]